MQTLVPCCRLGRCAVFFRVRDLYVVPYNTPQVLRLYSVGLTLDSLMRLEKSLAAKDCIRVVTRLTSLFFALKSRGRSRQARRLPDRSQHNDIDREWFYWHGNHGCPRGRAKAGHPAQDDIPRIFEFYFYQVTTRQIVWKVFRQPDSFASSSVPSRDGDVLRSSMSRHRGPDRLGAVLKRRRCRC